MEDVGNAGSVECHGAAMARVGVARRLAGGGLLRIFGSAICTNYFTVTSRNPRRQMKPFGADSVPLESNSWIRTLLCENGIAVRSTWLGRRTRLTCCTFGLFVADDNDDYYPERA